MKRLLLSFLLIFSVVITAGGVKRLHATEKLPLNSQLKRIVSETFYTGMNPDKEKIENYRRQIRRRYQDIRLNLTNVYTLIDGKSKKKALKKVKKKNEIEAYEILLSYVDQLQHLTDPVEFQRLAITILHIDYALKISARKLASTELIEKIPFSLRPKKIPIHDAPMGEASNLLNSKTGEFYNQEELNELKRNGVDISALNPPSDGTFWVHQDISHIDVKTNYATGQDQLHKGISIIFPEKEAYFEKVRKTQSKPKLDLFIRHEGKKLEFKLKIGAELYSETTCAALFTTMGFSADITKYVQNFKVLLGEMNHDEFRLEWQSYYSNYDPEKYVKTWGKDDQGYFVVFHEGVLEAKPKELLRIGPWAYGDNGNGGLREVRGLLLFNMWVSNLDLKEWENNKLIARDIDGKYKFFHIQHDMGFSFGKTYMERPGSFLWNLVKKKTDEAIYMNFNCLVDNSLFRIVTFADARWMVRLIARLSRKQIADAVDIGGWPVPVRGLLVEKLIARRNQLVEAFELVGEKTPEGETISLLKFDRQLTTGDGAVVDGNLKTYRFEGSPQYFGPRANEIIALILKGIRNGILDSIVNLAASVRYIELEPEWFNLDRRIVSKIILRMNREIESNPDPANPSESFLVKDTMQIGLRLGYGSVVSGEIAYWRKYVRVYPVKTRDEGRFHDKFIMNLLMPFKERGHNLPRNHVTILEDWLEGRGKLRLDGLNDMLEFNFTSSRVNLRRQFTSVKMDQKNQRAIFFEDKSNYNELKFRVFFKFLHIFHSNPFYSHLQKGNLHRRYIHMDLTDVWDNPEKQKALELLIADGNPSLMKSLGQERQLDDQFWERKSHLKLLGMLRLRSVYRVDKVNRQDPSGNPQNDSQFLQIENRKLKAWSFADNGERFLSKILLTAKAGTNEKGDGTTIDEPLLILSLQVNDRSTFDSELKDEYLQFIDSVALESEFIPFDSTLHSGNRLWGHTRTIVNLYIYPNAVERLLNLEEEEIWQAMAEVTGKSTDYWQSEARPKYRKGRPIPGYYTPHRYLAIKTCYFIRQLVKARKENDAVKKMKNLVNGIRKTIYISGHMYNPVLLAVIHKLVGEGNVYMNGMITYPGHKESLFPAREPLYNEKGTRMELEYPLFQFIFDDPSEIYHLF